MLEHAVAPLSRLLNMLLGPPSAGAPNASSSAWPQRRQWSGFCLILNFTLHPSSHCLSLSSHHTGEVTDGSFWPVSTSPSFGPLCLCTLSQPKPLSRVLPGWLPLHRPPCVKWHPAHHHIFPHHSIYFLHSIHHNL